MITQALFWAIKWISSKSASIINPQSMVPGPAASVSSRNLLEMQILGPYLRPTESETQQVEPSNLLLNKPSR